MKESKFVKTKIVAGYLLLIAVCILSVGYVYRVAVRFSAPDRSYALLHTKRSAVNRTLYHLYQAESYGQLMIAGYASYEARYRRELRTVRASIDSLRALTVGGDSLQTMRLDSITRLIADKERRTVSLRRSIRAGATAGLLDKNIRSLIGPREAVVADTIPFRSIVRQDTTAVPRAKRRFFQRLGDLFSPPEADSSLVISRRETIAPVIPVDAVKDTIVLVLQALQDSVTSNRQGIYDHAWQEGLRLSYSNELVNTKIYRLIMDFEAEDTAYLMQRIERNEAFRRRSSRILGGVAIGAVVLMLLFVGMLWRDINRSNRYRRELERANRDKESLLEAREKLMLAITHDIKAPLGSVMGYIDLLARLTGDKRQELYLRNMKGSSEHLLALVNSLLDFYRLDINKIEVCCVAFSPAQLFENIRAGFAAAAAAKGLELRLEAEPAAAGEVSGDALHIRQIADNLISNALKFTDEGSVTLRVDVVRGRLVFSVRDTGRGIGREGTHLRRVRAFEFGAGSRRIRVGAVDRRPSREVVGRYDFARKPSRRGEQIHRVGPRRRSGGRECGCRSRRVCAPGGTTRAAGRRRSPATRNDRRDVPPCRDRMRELPISRVCRQTRRREPFRFGADRFADAVGRRVRRAGGGARGRSRAESGRRVGARGPGRCGFRGPGVCGVPPQAVHLQRTGGGDTGGLRQRGDRPAGRGPGDPVGGRGRFYGSDGLCRGRSRGGAKHPALVCRTDGGKLRGA